MITPRRALRDTAPPIGHVQVDSWRDRAACNNHRTLPASTWDDSADGDKCGRISHREERIEQAKAVCGTCPVKDQCLADVDLAFDDGVRGGVDLRQLREAARRRAIRQAVSA